MENNSLPSPVSRRTLSGWGNYPRVECDVVRPERRGSLQQIVVRGGQGLVARGLARSYGDPAVSDPGLVIDCTRLDRYVAFDEQTGTLTCEGGTSLEAILRDFAPRGWMPMITPGTKYVTVGGCIANDVHGKAHHADGCFSRCVESFRVLLASGETVNASPEENSDLFWASFGGMGLLGVIVEATILLRRVETTYFRQTAVTVRDLDELLDAFDTYHHVPYSVAWIDSLARGKRLGQGVLTVGDHASINDLPSRLAKRPLATSGGSMVNLPVELPSAALNTGSIAILNQVLNQVQKHAAPVAHYEKFFYPLDFVNNWNRGYGANGFTQYQFVVPLEGGRENLRELLEMVASSGHSPFLNVLKRLGPERPETMLSFPREGYTFAIDFPVRPGLRESLQRLDARVVQMGGRVYLGKDAFLSPAHFEAMYPKLPAWRAIKDRYDPDGVFSSNLSRRLRL